MVVWRAAFPALHTDRRPSRIPGGLSSQRGETWARGDSFTVWRPWSWCAAWPVGRAGGSSWTPSCPAPGWAATPTNADSLITHTNRSFVCFPCSYRQFVESSIRKYIHGDTKFKWPINYLRQGGGWSQINVVLARKLPHHRTWNADEEDRMSKGDFTKFEILLITKIKYSLMDSAYKDTGDKKRDELAVNQVKHTNEAEKGPNYLIEWPGQTSSNSPINNPFTNIFI